MSLAATATIWALIEELEAFAKGRARSARAVAKVRAAFEVLQDALEPLLTRTETARALCTACSELQDRHYALSTAMDPDSLPSAAYLFIPSELVSESRGRAYVRCRSCETVYLYERDYEFLVPCSEDEETLTRMNPSSAVAVVERALAGVESDKKPLREAVERLRTVLGRCDVDEEQAARRAEAREVIARRRKGPQAELARALSLFVEEEARARAGCGVCRLLPAAEEPVSELGKYITLGGSSGPRRCPTCGQRWQVRLGGGPALDYRLDRWGWAERLAAEDLDALDEALDAWPPAPSEGTPALHIYVENGLEQAVQAMLEGGADPDAPDGYEWTPLMRAVSSGSVEMVERLLEAELDIDRRNLVGETALFLAAERGDALLVDRLLEVGADPRIPCAGPNKASRRRGIEGVAPAGTSPAEVAARHGHDALAQRLREAE